MSYIDPRTDPTCKLYIDFTDLPIRDSSMYNNQIGNLLYDERADVFELDTNELILNGQFSNTSNWTPVRCNFSVSGNAAYIEQTSAGNSGYIYQTVSGLVQGSLYLMRCSVSSNYPSYPKSFVMLASGGNVLTYRSVNSTERISFYMPIFATVSSFDVMLGGYYSGAGGYTVAVDVSLRKILSKLDYKGLLPSSTDPLVTVPNIHTLGLSSSFTIIFWVTILSSGYNKALIKSTSPFIAMYVEQPMWAPVLQVELDSGVKSASGANFSLYEPTMFVGRYNSAIGLSFGVCNSSVIKPGSWTLEEGPIAQGLSPLIIGQYAKGTIFHEVAMYNRVFDDQDIKDYYENTKSKYIGG